MNTRSPRSTVGDGESGEPSVDPGYASHQEPPGWPLSVALRGPLSLLSVSFLILSMNRLD